MEYQRDLTLRAELPAPKIPVVEQPNKGGLGVAELRKDPAENVIVTAPLLSSVAVLSTLVLFWDNLLVDSYVLTEDQYASGLIVFSVPSDQILDSDSSELVYQAYSPVGGNPSASGPYYVRVNTKAPGNPPLNSTEPINYNLTPPHNIPAVITDAIAAVGIDVLIDAWLPPSHMEVGDVLTLTWGQTKLTQAPLTTADLNRPVTVHVSEAVILATSNTLGLEVFYDIRDNVGNWSLLSPSAKTDVEAGPSSIVAPRVLDAVGDNDIDLAELGTRDVRVLIPVYTAWTINDRVILYWFGSTPEGAEVNEIKSYTMQGDDEGFAVELQISNAAAIAIAGGRAIVYYEVNGTRRSRRVAITVSGVVKNLPEPSVTEALNGVLDPADVTAAGATVVVPAYAGMSNTDSIILYWAGTTADGGNTFFSTDKPGNNNNRDVIFNVPKTAHVDSLAGGSVSLYYHVTNAANIGRDSDILPLVVKSAGPATGWESFEEQALFVLPLNTAVAFNNNLKITVTAATAVTAVVVPPPELIQFADRALRCAANNVIKFDFGGTIASFKISHAQTSTSQSILEFFDAAGTRVYTYPLIPPAGGLVRYENISLRPPRSCTYCVLTVDSVGLLVDNFIWD